MAECTVRVFNRVPSSNVSAGESTLHFLESPSRLEGGPLGSAETGGSSSRSPSAKGLGRGGARGCFHPRCNKLSWPTSVQPTRRKQRTCTCTRKHHTLVYPKAWLTSWCLASQSFSNPSLRRVPVPNCHAAGERAAATQDSFVAECSTLARCVLFWCGHGEGRWMLPSGRWAGVGAILVAGASAARKPITACLPCLMIMRGVPL